jgi:hypothetical protein
MEATKEVVSVLSLSVLSALSTLGGRRGKFFGSMDGGKTLYS